ncbi:MAG: HAMP domain-containing sensor histidine kinase [Pseudomonadota bacterium]
MAWSIVGLGAVAIGGGAVSPLALMLVLGPLTAYALGKIVAAMEAVAIGLLVYAVCVTVGQLGWSDLAPESWNAMIVPWVFATLAQIGVLFWVIGKHPYFLNTDARPVDAGLIDLDLSAPLLLVEVAPEGRIRRVEGPRRLRWHGLQPGQEASLVLPSLDVRDMTAPNGIGFHVRKETADTGASWLALLPKTEFAVHQGADLEKLAAQAKASEEALAERTAFFAGLGHDLKTPLNAILGFADLMKAEVRGPMPDAYKEYPAIIHESGQDLMLLVDDILDLAKSEASGHRLDMEPVDLLASGMSVQRQLEDQAQRAGVTLHLLGEGEVWANADARAVRQIWQNLVSNAIKYSGRGDQVTLCAGLTDETTFLSVEDEGAGMDEADLNRIAKPFAQGDNSRGRAGTGLGLAVVHRFAELHGGQVVIDTAPGRGTRVRVTLPLADITGLTPLEDAAQ